MTERLQILNSGSALKLVLRDVEVSDADIKAAFSWLGKWEVAAPLKSYKHLACDEGTEEERRFTKELVGGDLRQLLYDSRAIWFRVDNERATEFMHVLDLERALCHCKGGCDLPFLRAMWKVKPLILALPKGLIQPAKE